MKRLKHLIASLAILLAPVLVSIPVSAWSPFQGVDCGADAGGGSAICQDKGKNKDPLTGTNGVLVKITNIVAIVAGIAAVVIIVLAGIRFITAGGSSEDIAGARRTIVYAVIGLIIIVLGRTLIVFVIGKL
jgi:hypothetical protein